MCAKCEQAKKAIVDIMERVGVDSAMIPLDINNLNPGTMLELFADSCTTIAQTLVDFGMNNEAEMDKANELSKQAYEVFRTFAKDHNMNVLEVLIAACYVANQTAHIGAGEVGKHFEARSNAAEKAEASKRGELIDPIKPMKGAVGITPKKDNWN
jgi:hypothetical protein